MEIHISVATMRALEGVQNPHRRFLGVLKRKIVIPRIGKVPRVALLRCQCNYCGLYQWVSMSAFKAGFAHQACSQKIRANEAFIKEANRKNRFRWKYPYN